MKAHSLESFYTKFGAEIGDKAGLNSQLHEVGHFNIFNIATLAPSRAVSGQCCSTAAGIIKSASAPAPAAWNMLTEY